MTDIIKDDGSPNTRKYCAIIKRRSEDQTIEWTSEMDRIICEGYYRDRRVANVKPLLV